MLTRKERIMAAWLMERASEEFSNHGCNDLPGSFILETQLTDEEKVQFVRDYIKWNEHRLGENVEPEDFDLLPDWAVMDFLAYKLREE